MAVEFLFQLQAEGRRVITLLKANQYVDELSKTIATQDRSEQNFKRFMTYLNAVAARQNVGKAGLVATKGAAKGAPRKKGKSVAVK